MNVLVFLLITAITASNTEYYIKSNYTGDPGIRPITDSSQPINVNVGLGLVSLQIVDMIESFVQFSVWLRTSWTDTYTFTGMTQISWSTNPIDRKVWIPDIYEYNSLDYNPEYHADVYHYQTGSMFLSKPMIIRTRTNFDLVDFPFDTQTVKLAFGGWSLSGNLQNLELMTTSHEIVGDLSHPEWSIRSITSERVVVYYSCCPDEGWPQIQYTIVMKRKSAWYIGYYYVPMVMMQLVALCSYGLRYEIGERMGISMSTFLASIAIQIFAARVMPVTTQTTGISKFFYLCISFHLLHIFLNVVVMWWMSRPIQNPDHPKPYVKKCYKGTCDGWIGVITSGLFFVCSLGVLLSKS